MKKQRNILFKDERHKEFSRIFGGIKQGLSRHQVWSDFVTISACIISNACDAAFLGVRKEMHLQYIKQYSKDDLDKFADLLSLTVQSLDECSAQDFLGEIYTGMGLSNARLGQFFTPYPIALSMVRMTLDVADVQKSSGQFSIYDPACGAGCMFIACANYLKEKGINYQQKILFVGQDIAPLVAKMCYIQLSMLGCDAIIKIGDSLTDPFMENEPLTEKIWRTPMHILSSGMRAIGEANTTDGVA